MPVRRLPSHPNLNHLKYQARDLLRDHAARLPEAAQRIREFHPRMRGAADAEIFETRLCLSDAQLTIAREAGFASWAKLKRHVEKPTRTDRLDLPHHERIGTPRSDEPWIFSMPGMRTGCGLTCNNIRISRAST